MNLKTYINDITTNPLEWGTFEEWIENVKIDFLYGDYGKFKKSYIKKLKIFYKNARG